MKQKSTLSFITGFILLFFLYHLPEYFSAFWIAAVCKIGFTILALAIGFVQGKNGLAGFGLALKNRWAGQGLAGLLTGLSIYALTVFINHAAGFETVQSFNGVAGWLQQLPMLLLMTMIPSVAEDILTRGYLYGHLGKKMPDTIWIFLSAAVFLLNHYHRLGEGAPVLSYIFIMGLALAFTVARTGALWLAFGIHWGSNLCFESSNVLLKTETMHADAAHYVLAGCWAVCGLILFFVLRKTGGRLTD